MSHHFFDANVRVFVYKFVWRLGWLVLGLAGGLVLRIRACKGLELDHNEMSSEFASRVPLVYSAEHREGLEAGLGLYTDRLFDQIVLAIEFSIIAPFKLLSTA